MALRTQDSNMILAVDPDRLASNVKLNKEIRVTFQRDMDADTINASTFQVASNQGHQIKGEVYYSKQKAYFKPDNPLDPDTTYQVTLIGESETEEPEGEGIRDILGNYLYGNYTWTFTTTDSITIESPQLKEPYNEVYLEDNPIEFSWERPEGAVRFEIQVAKDRAFRTVLWPEEITQISSDYITPDIEFADGQYYWRVRAIDSRERPSKWSNIWTFSIDTLKKGKVAPEDTIAPEVVEAGYTSPRELAELFPEKEQSNIDLNLGAVVIKVLGDVDPDEVGENNFKITGYSITDGSDPVSHGKVAGSISVFKRDGLSYIVFQPEPMEEQ